MFLPDSCLREGLMGMKLSAHSDLFQGSCQRLISFWCVSLCWGRGFPGEVQLITAASKESHSLCTELGLAGPSHSQRPASLVRASCCSSGPSTRYAWVSSVLRTLSNVCCPPWCKRDPHPDFTDRETEAHPGEMTCPMPYCGSKPGVKALPQLLLLQL